MPRFRHNREGHLKRWGVRGQSLVELAIMLILFLTVLFMVIDWGWVYFQRHELNRRVTNAARWGAARNLTADMDPAIVQQVRNLVSCDNPAGGCTPIFNVGAGNGAIQVQVQTRREQIYGATGPKADRFYVVVRVTGFQFHHITPFHWEPVASASIESAQPAECQEFSQADCPVT